MRAGDWRFNTEKTREFHEQHLTVLPANRQSSAPFGVIPTTQMRTCLPNKVLAEGHLKRLAESVSGLLNSEEASRMAG
jgi:hypothetical protein